VHDLAHYTAAAAAALCMTGVRPVAGLPAVYPWGHATSTPAISQQPMLHKQSE
jgi:hypothetical protein